MSYDFEERVITSLARLETQMEDLVGNGQPGRITKIEDDVQLLRESRSSLMGAVAVLSATLSIAGSWLFGKLAGR